MNLSFVIKSPLITEKATSGLAANKYSFKVALRAKKSQIKKAVEMFFGVKVIKVKTMTVRGKKKRVGRSRRESQQADWKKAIVQLKEGDKIDAFKEIK